MSRITFQPNRLSPAPHRRVAGNTTPPQEALRGKVAPLERALAAPHPPSPGGERGASGIARKADALFRSVGEALSPAVFFPFMGSLIAAGFMAYSLPLATDWTVLNTEQKQRIEEAARPGDVLLVLRRKDAAPYIAQQLVFGSRYSHAAMVTRKGEVVEAEFTVHRTPLSKFLQSARRVVLLRPRWKDEDQRRKAVRFAEEQLGRWYNITYDSTQDRRFYCSELVAKALRHAGTIDTLPLDSFLGKELIVPDALMRLPCEVVAQEEALPRDHFTGDRLPWSLARKYSLPRPTP